MKILENSAGTLTLIAGILVSASCQPPTGTGQNNRTADQLVNVALFQEARASGVHETFLPSNAVDGNIETSWIVAGGPGNWIEIDLGEDLPVHRIELVAEQTPEGETTHRVLGKGAKESEYRELFVLEGFTAGGQILLYNPSAPWADLRFIRVETTRTPSWVAWKEIRVFSQG